MRNWEKHVKKYIRQCETRGLVESTLERRAKLLLDWGVWLRMRRPAPSLEEVGRETEYSINYIISRTAFRSKSFTYSVVSNLRCMGRYLVEEGVWTSNPLKWIEGPHMDPWSKLPRRISKQRLRKLLEGAGRTVRRYDRHVMLVILTLLYSTGMRRGELERLRVRDWDRENALINVDGKKTGRERKIPVPEIVYRSIEAYLPLRQNLLLEKGAEQERLLINQRGRPLTGDKISSRISRLCRRIGIEPVTVHQFRHSCASDMLEEGAGILEVQKVLGHATVSTTFRYTAVSDPERKRAISQHPINRMLGRGAEKGGVDERERI